MGFFFTKEEDKDKAAEEFYWEFFIDFSWFNGGLDKVRLPESFEIALELLRDRLISSQSTWVVGGGLILIAITSF